MSAPSLRKTLGLAWPLILGNASIPLLGIADTAIAGRIPGATALATVAVGSAWITLAFWAFSFLRQATGGLTAQAIGRSDTVAANGYLHKGLTLALGLGLLIAMGHFFAASLVAWAGVNPSLTDSLAGYLEIRFAGAPAVLGLYVIYGWLIGQGLTRRAVLILLGMNLSNIVLSYLFGLVLGRGAQGIALGTALSEWMTLIAALVGYRDALKTQWQLQGMPRLLSANGWVMIRTLGLLAVFSWFNTQSAQMSADVAAINAVLLTLLSVAAYALDGFADAAEIQVGQAMGRRNRDWVSSALRYTALCSALSAVLATTLLALLSHWAVGWLVPQPELSAQIQGWLWWLIPLPLVAWISYWMDGVYLGLNAFALMAVVMLTATLGVYFPLNLWLSDWGQQGQWIAFWAWQLARAGLMLAVFAARLRPSRLPA